MHFEILVEDASGKEVLTHIMDKLQEDGAHPFTYKIISYKGVGRISRNLNGKTDASKRILLDRLPKLLQGYGNSLKYVESAVIVVVDLDDRDCLAFKQELLDLLASVHPHPKALFRIAIEEVESWLLGDLAAVKKAYPRAKTKVLGQYKQDSICGTWEVLADAVSPGGAQELKKSGFPHIGIAKNRWAANIAPHLSISQNRSGSFKVFCKGIKKLLQESELSGRTV